MNWFTNRGTSRRFQGTQHAVSAMERLEIRQLLSADAGGNSLAAATRLGAISGIRVVNDAVSAADPNDFYRIQVAQQSDVRLDLTGMRADADLQLLDSSGRILGRSANGGSRSESLNQTLSAGTYFVRVYRYSGDTNYSLSVRVQPVVLTPPDSAGNSTSAARNLGTLTGSSTYSDFVGVSDRDDYFRFQVTGRSVFDLALTQLAADADVELLNSSETLIARSNNYGNNSESIRQTLDGGSYFIRLRQYAGDTTYRMTLTITPDNPDGAGNSMSQARQLGVINGTVTINDRVDAADPADYYRFTVSADSNVLLRLSNLSADANVRVLDASGRQVAASTLGGVDAELIDRVFAQGDYFVHAWPHGAAETNYALSITATRAGSGGLDVSTVSPITDYDGHLGADYMAVAGTVRWLWPLK